MVSGGVVQTDDLFGFRAEQIDVVIAHQIVDLHVCAVQSSQRHRAVEHHLHVARSGSLLGSQGNLLGNIRGGNQLLRLGHVIVLHHHQLQVRAHLRIIVDELLQAQEQMDDVLCNGVGRRRLRAENHGDGALRQIALLDLLIFVNGVQRVHLLSLVLVETLDLDVKNRIFIDVHILRLLQVLFQVRLGFLLDFSNAVQNRFVILISHQLFQLGRVLHKIRADQTSQIIGEPVVAVNQPSAEGDAVGLVVEFLRINIVEGLQLGILQNLCVKRRHAVHRIAVMDVDVGHVNSVFLIDDIHPLIVEIPSHPGIQVADDGKQVGNHFFQIGNGPFLQRLRQNGVIGVGTGLSHHIHRRIRIEASRLQQTDQLRNHHGGMGVVDLDAHMLMQVIQVHPSLLRFRKDELSRVAHHEILLIDSQKLSGLIAVIGIQEEGQISSDIIFVKIDSVSNNVFIHAVQVEQMQAVAAVLLIPRHVDVVHGGSHGEVFERHFKMALRPGQPAFRRDPGILFLILLVVLEFLQEQAVVIVQSHAVSGQPKRRDGIQEAGSKPSQTAVSQRGLQLDLLNLGNVLPVLLQHISDFLKQPQIDQVVGKQLADEELCGNIIQLPASLVSFHSFHSLFGDAQKRRIDFLIGRILNGLSEFFL